MRYTGRRRRRRNRENIIYMTRRGVPIMGGKYTQDVEEEEEEETGRTLFT